MRNLVQGKWEEQLSRTGNLTQKWSWATELPWQHLSAELELCLSLSWTQQTFMEGSLATGWGCTAGTAQNQASSPWQQNSQIGASCRGRVAPPGGCSPTPPWALSQNTALDFEIKFEITCCTLLTDTAAFINDKNGLTYKNCTPLTVFSQEERTLIRRLCCQMNANLHLSFSGLKAQAQVYYKLKSILETFQLLVISNNWKNHIMKYTGKSKMNY